MESLKFKGELRTETGTKAAKAARRAGLIPCELYGGNENVHFAVSPKDVKDLVYTPDFRVSDIDINGKIYRAIMKSIQFHPVSEEILHIDFLKLDDGRQIKIEVPVRFTGVAPGVKSGGKLTQKLHRIQIKTTPEHMIDEVVLNISKVKLGQSVRVRDIKIGDKVEVLNNPNIPVASVTIPRALKTTEMEELEEEEGVEADAEAGAETETTTE